MVDGDGRAVEMWFVCGRVLSVLELWKRIVGMASGREREKGG